MIDEQFMHRELGDLEIHRGQSEWFEDTPCTRRILYSHTVLWTLNPIHVRQVESLPLNRAHEKCRGGRCRVHRTRAVLTGDPNIS